MTLCDTESDSFLAAKSLGFPEKDWQLFGPKNEEFCNPRMHHVEESVEALMEPTSTQRNWEPLEFTMHYAGSHQS